MEIDHIGYAVKDLNAAIGEFQDLGFQKGNIIEDTERNVNICFMEGHGYKIELVTPAGENSPVDYYLKRNGSMPYHICYKVVDLKEEIEKLEKKGFKIIKPPQNAVAFGEKYVVFMFGAGIGLFEIVGDEMKQYA